MNYTTLNDIKAFSPCKTGWEKLLAGLGKTKADDEPLPYSKILEINGIADAIWSLRTSRKLARAYAIACAELVLPLFEKRYPEDMRVRECIEATKGYIAGTVSLDELRSKRAADADAAADAADAAADAADAADAAYAAAAAADADADAAYAAYAAAAADADAAADAAYAAAAADAAADAAYAAAADAATDAAAAADDAAYATTAATATAAARQEFKKKIFLEIVGA